MQAQRSSLSQSSSSFSSSQVPSTPSQRTRRRDLMMLPPQSPNALSSLMQNDPFDDPLDLIQLKSQRQDRYDPVQTDEGSMTPMDVEVGRDAIPESQQLDFRRESFLNGDDELSTASKRQPELPMGAENITFEAPFPFSDGPDLGDMHMDHNDDTFQMGDNDVASLALEHPDLPLTLSFEMPSRAGSVPQSPARSVFADPFSALNRSGSSTSRTPSTVKEAPRKKPVQKRKELELDSVIELDAGAMSRQMRETADISKKPKLLPLTREMEEWEKMTAKDLLGLGAFGRMPARFAHLLKIHESAPMAPIPRRASAIRPFEPADDNPVIQESQDLLEDIHFDGSSLIRITWL